MNDNGIKYAGYEFQEFLRDERFVRDTAVAGTPQQKRKAEQVNQRTKENSSCLLLYAGPPPLL